MFDLGGVCFKGYKSFPEEDYAEMRDIKNVNVIIGKNNSGKSSIVDIVSCLVNKDHKNKIIEPLFILREKNLDILKNNNYGIDAYGRQIRLNEALIRQHFIGKYLRVVLSDDTVRHHKYKAITLENEDVIKFSDSILSAIANTYTNIFNEYIFRRLNAERNILPENQNSEIDIKSNGDGASNLVRQFINHSSLPEALIEENLLKELNKIMFPEAIFSNIRIQDISNSNEPSWEIFLEEKNAGRFALSQSGSGLKTIILILLNLWLIPELSKFKDKNIVFAFEEIENNLHPALQRKVFEYLYEFAIKKDICIFITTHSHIAINTYYEKENAKIFHIIKENNKSTIKTIETHIDKINILDDLDVKASDLLQSNGIIWVEGPSDRIYIKKWLEVFTENEYKEGEHYQFLYYGGKLLSHYSTEDSEDLINILLTNRNSAIVIDSDKISNATKINDTKKRVRSEFEEKHLFCWITKGKEIENYLSHIDISNCLETTIKMPCMQFRKFPDYIKKHYENFSNKKVLFAQKMIQHISAENSSGILDLKKQIEKLYKSIEIWNKK